MTTGFAGMLAAIAAFWPDVVHARGVRGSIHAVSGHPVGNAQVSLYRVASDGAAACLGRAWTEADGSYQLPLDLPGDRAALRLEACAVDFLPASAPLQDGANDLDLVQLVPLEGLLVGEPGMPLAGLLVQAVDAADERQAFAGRTRWDGTFALRVAPGRSYTVRCQPPDGRIEPARDVAAGTLSCELRLTK